MEKNEFSYHLGDDTIVFYGTLTESTPFISHEPRYHENIFFVTDGTLLYERGEEKISIKKGEVGYISRGSRDKSSAYQCDSVSYIAVSFRFDTQNRTPTLPFGTVCSTGLAYDYEALFTEALEHFSYRLPGYKAICNGITLQIIGYLYNEFSLTGSKHRSIVRLRDALEHMKNNYSDPELSIAQLAQIANMGEKQFRRVFFDVYQKTPYAFLQDFRIEKARILLLNVQAPIGEIALQCGFADVYSFSHCFKRHTGMSPTEYKKAFTY